MKRRAFTQGLVGAAAALPLATHAQQPARVPRVAVLLYSTPQSDLQMPAFRGGLRERGYTEGRNLAIEYRYADGRPERLPELAAELVGTKPDVLFSIGGEVTSVAVKATRTIPIVFTSSADPVQLQFVASIARPGGSATGATFLLDELAAKRLELLKEASPAISRVACIYNPDHLDNELLEAERAARTLGMQLHPLEVRDLGAFDGAFEMATKARVDALYVVSSRLTLRGIERLIGYAARNRLPLAGGWGAWAQQGGLLSYGPNVNEMVRGAVTYMDKILKGASPGDLPVQQPTKFELVLNLKTAKSLNLTVPASVLSRADETIE